ncbi:hypothetical protein CA234_06835 [Sphingomonas sp. ABOLE]|uniref:hypothetical protein n=1 Tax=Sphingomonas sp. ABOLE TaxID=1985878 RepID=UPI000F7EB96B|nr:hypothetical protein [Sphingomonas sp. ABOLE]RSV42510.1 hypothetical protein CA234_06835 [Sphingomonas sp. ABOLE]
MAGGLVEAKGAPVQAEAGAARRILPAGVHRVVADQTIDGDLQLQPGAVLDIAAGATLRVLGEFAAPVARVFTGGGRVDLNQSRTPHAHPEWWGAAPGNGAVDSLPALAACLAAHPVLHLLAADYFLSDTWVIERPFVRVSGAGFRGTVAGAGTRLVMTNGTADVLRVGPARRPRMVNDYPQNIVVTGIALCRSAPVAGNPANPPAGMRAQFLLFARFEEISAAEHGIGFVARGLVRSQMSNCVAFRSIPGTQRGAPWRGFFLDGTQAIGLAGGNASLFLTDCNATIGGDPALGDNVGLLLEGAFADSFITNFETAGPATGIRVDGQTAEIGGRARDGHVNLHLHMPVIDQCGAIGIDIRDTSPQALIDISDPYVAAAPSAQAAIQCVAQRGAISIQGGQLVGGTNSRSGGHAAGLLARDSAGVQVNGLKILEHVAPVVLDRCQGFAVQAWVGASRDMRAPAASLRQCGRGSVALLLGYGRPAYSAGVELDTESRRIRIDASGLDDAALLGGADSRVRIGNRPAAQARTADIVIEGA